MPTLKQKSSFGPGKYRGIPFDRDRLLRYVEGTNKALAAGVPIPLLDRRHAKPGATDKETAEEAEVQGVGWLTKLSLDENDSIEWEAKDVPQAVIDEVKTGTKRYTSPEFRDSYTNEKEGVYEGPIVRHITFTPLPGNPHQGELVPLESIALTELGVFQFSEMDRGTDQFAEEDKTKNKVSHEEKYRKWKIHYDNAKSSGLDDETASKHAFDIVHGKVKVKVSQHAEDDTEAVTDENAAPDDVDNGQVDPDEETDITKGKKKKKKEDGTDEEDDAAEGEMNENEKEMNEKNPQFAENPAHSILEKHGYKLTNKGQDYHSYTHPETGHEIHTNKDTGRFNMGKNSGAWTHVSQLTKHLKKQASTQHAEDDEEVLVDEMGNIRPDSPAETGLPPDIVPINEGTNPDMPPVANDRSKLQAVIAGLNQAANLVLPSDFDFANPGSIDILLAALNTAIKSKQEAEAEAAMETEQQEKGNLTEAPMPFSEADYENTLTKHGYTHTKSSTTGGGWKKYKKGKYDEITTGNHGWHRDTKHVPGVSEGLFVRGDDHTGLAAHLEGKPSKHKSGHYLKDDSQHNETQFSESELAALTPKARAIVEKAEADRKQAEQEKLQFAESEKAAKQSLARTNSLTRIKSFGLPPYVVKQLTASMETIQFSENGTPQPTYTIEDVARIIKRAMPASMMFDEKDVKEAEAPKNGIQFFEGETPAGHVSAEQARAVVANNPMLKPTRHGATQPHASVASINEFLKNDLKAHPLNTMK